MRKCLSLFLACLMAIQSFGLLLYYMTEINRCKTDFKEQLFSKTIADYLLVEFSNKKKDFQLIGNDEILHQGKLFDIVKKTSRKGEIVYYAISDEKEDGYSVGVSLLSKENSNENNGPVKTAKYQLFKYTADGKYFNLITALNSRIVTKIKPAAYITFYASPCMMIFSPPPDPLFS